MKEIAADFLDFRMSWKLRTSRRIPWKLRGLVLNVQSKQLNVGQICKILKF